MPFKIDLHTHSFFSGDGVSSPEQNIAAARAKGLHGFAMTDHNTNEGVDYCREKGLIREDGQPVDGFLIIPGVEVTTAEGHLLCDRRVASLSEGHARARSLRPHPRARRARHPAASLRSLPRRHSFFHFGKSALSTRLEVFNAATTLRRYNRYAFKYAQVRGLPMTAASDAHHHAAIGTAYTILDTEDFSLAGVLAQLVKSNELNQEYLTPRDSVRKTWNNWMRLRRRRPVPVNGSGNGA